MEKKRLLRVGKNWEVKADKNLLLAGRMKLTEDSKKATYTGEEKLTLKVGDTEIVISKGTVTMKTKGSIKTSTTGATCVASSSAKQK